MKKFNFNKKNNKRIMLNMKDFEKITNGEVIKKDGVEIALQDIGFFTMLRILKENMYGKWEEKE